VFNTWCYFELVQVRGKIKLFIKILGLLKTFSLQVHDCHNDGVFNKATKSLKMVVLTCYLSHLPKIHR